MKPKVYQGGFSGVSGCVNHKLALHIEPRITEQDHFVLKHLLSKVIMNGVAVAEIGSFLGNGSTKTIIESVKDIDGTFYCIDTWTGNQNVKWHLRLADEYSLFDTFLYHAEKAGGGSLVKPMMMKSEDAAVIFRDRSLDFLFIDGDHSYTSVKEDIESWKGKVRPGGILCGHDCEGALQDFDINLVNNNLDKDFVKIPEFRFEGAHLGCVKAVHEALGGLAKVWAHEDLSKYGFHGRSTIWSIVL